MISYSITSRRAYARLMRQYNDIDVYVEDKTYVGIYERLINKALGGRAKVTKVIALGPREEVLKAALNDNTRGGRPRLYIVDGDLDIIATLRQRRAPHLHRLRVYSLENLLFERKALEAYCAFACPQDTTAAAIAAVDLDSLTREIDEAAHLLIVALGIARRLQLRGATYALNHPSIFRKNGGKYVEVDRKALKVRVAQIGRQIRIERGRPAYRAAKAEVLKAISKKRLRGLEYFPGKALLWYLNERTGAAQGASLQQRVIASYLAERCNLSLDAVLARRLRSVARV